MSALFLKQEEFTRIFKSHLKIETYTKSIESLFSLRLLNRIDYKPYYQRNYVWDDDKASYFIESILLGTEIPPLIFFTKGDDIEIIDGRQRFETIKRFKDSEFALTKNGLFTLKQLAKLTYNLLGSETPEIIEIFLDAKIRVIEFQIVNEPKLDPDLEDKIKKEIFGRYNSGITPLKRPEIENAIYDQDEVSKVFKQLLKTDIGLKQLIYSLFFEQRIVDGVDIPVEAILQFIRRNLVLDKLPIKYYASGGNRREVLTKLYEHFSNNVEDVNSLCQSFITKVRQVSKLKEEFINISCKYNRFVFECLLWSMIVLEDENINLDQILVPAFKRKLAIHISNHIDKYSNEDAHHYNKIMERYSFTANFFEQELGVSFQVYTGGGYEQREYIKALRSQSGNDTQTKLNELETLRITKPDPSRNSIDDIARVMERRRFLVRPSYQRSEVINLSKASAIIESILLGIKLPPIFVYKRLDGVSEVIDGQQRILTILGFIGKEYIDEDGKSQRTKNTRFSLRNLRILKDLQGQRFDQLDDSLKELIYDFELFVVEIEQKLNKDFDPIDLFIRLNDKPYPILEHSFEMWNSWADREIISTIKEKVARSKNWFYLRKIRQPKDRDRMENEELYTSLAYLNYKYAEGDDLLHSLDIYQKTDRINARIRSKKDVSSVLTEISGNNNRTSIFMDSIKRVERFISKVKVILLDKDVEASALATYLEHELDIILKGKKETQLFTRRMQDFYILWFVLNKVNFEMVKHYRIQIKHDLGELFYQMKNIPEQKHIAHIPQLKFDQITV